MIRWALYRLFRWLAGRCIDPRLAGALPAVLAVADEQLRRSVLIGQPGLAVRGLQAAIELELGIDQATPALTQQLCDQFNPLLFAFEAAKAHRDLPQDTP